MNIGGMGPEDISSVAKLDDRVRHRNGGNGGLYLVKNGQDPNKDRHFYGSSGDPMADLK